MNVFFKINNTNAYNNVSILRKLNKPNNKGFFKLIIGTNTVIKLIKKNINNTKDYKIK